jgi:hypothetical protein
MQKKIIVTFIFSAGILLLLAAAAKIFSSYGTSKILNSADPLFHVSYRFIFRAVALLEVGVAGICFCAKNINWRVGSIAFMATDFALYRLGLYWMGFRGGCSCLGNLTDALHIPPALADRGMEVVLGYLLAGSFGAWFWLWRQSNGAQGRMRNETQLGTGNAAPGNGTGLGA